MKKRPTIVLIGFKGCGKSTVGRSLAKTIGGKFADTDKIVEDLYEEKNGERLSFREIYMKEGRGHFIDLEEKAVKKALAGDSTVVSLGGGTIENQKEAIDFGSAIVVGLGVEKDILYKRITKDGVPVFFDIKNPKESFDSFFEIRAARYNEFAEITVDNTDRAPEETAEAILEYMNGASKGFLEEKV